MIYVIAYKLKKKRDMTALFNELQNPPAGWAHHIDDVWFIATSETANQLYERIRTHFTQSDRFFIVESQEVV